MKQFVLWILVGLSAQTSTLNAESPRCVAGDDVRLRSAPSTTASIVRVLYLNNKFVHAEPASEVQTISGRSDNS